jgi:hypothetical protein
MDGETGNYPRGDIRVSDTERDQAVAELSEHFQTGRLTQEEFNDRSGRALQARTGRDLTALFTDLPRPAALDPWSSPAPGRVTRPSARGGRPLPTARLILAFVIVAIIAGNVLGHNEPTHWLAPVIILGFVLLRLSRVRR